MTSFTELTQSKTSPCTAWITTTLRERYPYLDFVVNADLPPSIVPHATAEVIDHMTVEIHTTPDTGHKWHDAEHSVNVVEWITRELDNIRTELITGCHNE